MDNTRLEQRQLENIFSEIHQLKVSLDAPAKGWLYAVRHALGMPQGILAKRLGVTPQAVNELEKREAGGSVTLGSLKRAAEAIDCTLVYILLPNTPLQQRVEMEAEKVVAEMMERTSRTMALEGQQITSEEEEEVRQQLSEKLMANPRLIWKAGS